MDNRSKGTYGEKQAIEYLISKGVSIMECNYRYHKLGEIDIIGIDGEYLVFFEVKSRSTTNRGHALQAVSASKQRQICRVADCFRMEHHIGDNRGIRYDVVAIQGGEITWVKNAFPHIYSRGR